MDKSALSLIVLSALNMILLGLLPSVGCRRTSYQSISAASARVQQQTSRTPLLLSIDGTDGRTDGRILDRYI